MDVPPLVGWRHISFLGYNLDDLLGPLAQLVEHLTLNQGVQGSSP